MKIKEYIGLKIIKVLSRLPLRSGRALGRAIGHLVWAMDGGKKEVTLTNLKLAYPQKTESERNALAKASIIETCILLPEFAKVWHLETKSEVEVLITSINKPELLTQDGRGLIILAPHLGNWEIGGQFIAIQRDVSALYSPPKQPGFEALVKGARERFGVNMHTTSSKGVIGLARDLKAGRAAFILPDQVPDTKGSVYAPFFGVQALTMTLATGLAKKTNSRMILMAAFSNPHGWDLVLEEVDAKAYDKNSVIAATAMNRSIESLINQQPAKYQWEYKRFKRQSDPNIRYY